MATFYESPCVLCGGPAEFTNPPGTDAKAYSCSACSASYEIHEPTEARLRAAPRALLRAVAEKVARVLPGKVAIILWPAGERFPVIQARDRELPEDDG